jgi:hypothetical protein
MVFQPEYGHLLSMPAAVAGEPLPYYRFIEIKEDKFVLGEKGTVVGVTVPSVQDYRVLKDGTTQKRDGYIEGEKPQILHTGVCHVELEEPVTMGEYLTCGTAGKAKNQSGSDSGSKILGMALDTRKQGKLVRVVLRVL